jgi:methylated-DNA-[protein]-cysteine S-methyltransferase
MSVTWFALFETAIGPCGLVWSKRGIVGVQLPEHSSDKTRARIRERFEGTLESEPVATVQRVITETTALLDGRDDELAAIVLDFDTIPAFSRRVYERTRRIPKGATLCYGDVARSLGSPHAARAVGQALGRNPWPLIVPCHRVIAANGKLTGFSAPGGLATKRRLLAIEGVYG